MSLLERCLQRSALPLRSLIRGLFCGEFAYVTRCSKCKFASRNMNAFNELELQIGVRWLESPTILDVSEAPRLPMHVAFRLEPAVK